MLYLFQWNSRFLIQKEVLKWKHAFEAKFGPENVTHIHSLDEYSLSELQESLVWRSLFSEKRLVIIDWYPYWAWTKLSNSENIEWIIQQSLESIPSEILVIFMSESPDKRLSWYKTIAKNAEVKDFSIAQDSDIFSKLHTVFWDSIDNSALQRIIKLKGNSYQKSLSEIQKLLIVSKHVSLNDVNENIFPEFEESIFECIDAIIEKDQNKLFLYLSNLIQFSNIYQLYQSLIANLRVFLYIELLKDKKIKLQKIDESLKLWKRKFLIQKRHQSNLQDLQFLYTELLNFDSDMKRWKLVSSEEKDIEKELERIFIRFLNR